MPDSRGRQGRTTYDGPNSWRKRTASGDVCVRTLDPNRCWHHDRPEKLFCPECIEAGEREWEGRVDA